MTSQNKVEIFKTVNKELHTTLSSFDFKKVQENNIGMYIGNSGTSLLLAQLYLYSKEDRYLEYLSNNIDYSLDFINKGVSINYLYSTGISGWGWLLNYLEKKQIFDFDSNTILNDIDDAINHSLNNYLLIPNIDQLNGAIGIARYFMARRKFEPVENIIRFLVKTKIEDDFEIKWARIHLKREGPRLFDFGLAHGMTGIIYFLSSCIKNNIQVEICRGMIDGAIRFMLNNIQDFDTVGSYFPTTILVEDYLRGNNITEKSRLSWCYGDLGIWYTLYKCSIQIKDVELQSQALKALKKLAKLPVENVDISDAGFCHGTSGLAHIFNKLFVITQDLIFEDASRLWLNATFTYGEAGCYKFFISKNTTEPQSCNTLLNGQGGMLLMYLNFLSSDFDWDEVFMLD